MTENLKHSIARAAGVVGIFTLISRLVGLYRDRLFASTFGAGDTLDAYYTAFRIPDLFFNLLVLGTLSVAFIPVFTEYFVKDPKEANKIANTVVNFAFLTMGLLMILVFPFVPALTHLIARGFTGDKFNLTVKLTRIFLLSPVIFTVSSVFSSVLNSLKRFLIVSIAPIIYNLGIIFGVKYLYPHYGVTGIAWGVIFGALGHLIIQFAGALKASFKYRPEMDLRHPGVRKIVRLFLPRIFGIDNNQFSLLVASVLGSTLISGSIAVFNLASNLQAVPIGIFAVSFAIAAFPNLSESFARKDDKTFNHILVRSIINILFFAIPISVMVILLRAQIIRIILGAGHFNWENTKLTANALGIFALSIFAQSLIPLFSRAFYARQNTWIPVIIGFLSLGFNFIFSYELSRQFGVLGLTLGFSLASIFNALALYLNLHSELKHLDDNYLIYSVLKILLSSFLMGAAMYITQNLLVLNLQLSTGVHVLIQSVSSALIGIGIFVISSMLLDMEQTQFVFKFLKEKVWDKMLFHD